MAQADDLFGPDWIRSRQQETQAALHTLIDSVVEDPRQAELLHRAVNSSGLSEPGRLSGAIHLPPLVYAAITGRTRGGEAASTIASLVWVGAELYDNLTDGDLPEAWQNVPEPDVVFTAFCSGCVLPITVIERLGVGHQIQDSLRRSLNEALLHSFAGQQQDLATTGSSQVSAEQVKRTIAGKNGAAKALFAVLGAQLAGTHPHLVPEYHRYGLALGCLSQLVSDHHELFGEHEARDLVQGTPTLLLAVALETADPTSRRELQELVAEARTVASARNALRSKLGTLRYLLPWCRIVRQYAADADAALRRAGPREPAATALRRLIDERRPTC